MNIPAFEVSETKKNRFAEFVSNFTHPPFLSIPTFIVLNLFLLDPHNFFVITGICVFFAAILPVGILIFWAKTITKDELDFPIKEDRRYPLLIVILSYLIGTVILFTLHAPPMATSLMFCYFSNTLVVFFINLYWKISIHSMGIAGPTTALFIVFGFFGSILAWLIPVVMWSRVYLKRHTMSQVIAGASLGFVFTGIQIKILYGFIFRINLDVFPIFWLVYAFIGPAIVLSIAGYLNNKGMKDGYTRKTIVFFGFISIVIYLYLAPIGATVFLLISGCLYVAIAFFSSPGFLWFDGIRRILDAP